MTKKISISFVSSVSDLNVGSYRIWIHDLAEYFKKLNIRVSINSHSDIIKSNEVIILGKSDVKHLNFYKKKYPDNIIGIINPPAGNKYCADFIIVGSIEEKDSLSKNKNVFIFPLIENAYSGIEQKHHSNKDNLVIGVHGSYTHLAKFNPHVKNAIEELNKLVDVHLKVITNPGAPNWKFGRPKIKNLEIIDWKLDTFSENLLKCDIGVVPNISSTSPIIKKTSVDKGLYNTDYFFRLKNKSNSGRMFVFIQHGIPVVADLTPSNMHILGNPKNGYAVFSKDGWLNSFLELLDFNKRNEVSQNAFKEFERLYNPVDWATNLISSIERMEKYVELSL